MPVPAKARVMPCLTTCFRTSFRRAPSAMRMPISRVSSFHALRMRREHLWKPWIRQPSQGSVTNHSDHRKPRTFRGVLAQPNSPANGIDVREKAARERGVNNCHLGSLVAVVLLGKRSTFEDRNTHGGKVAGCDLSKVHDGNRFPCRRGASFDIQS